MLVLTLLIAIPIAYAQDYPEYGVNVETIASNLSIPWSIDFAPDGRIFFTERTGQLWVIKDMNKPQSIMSLDVAGGEGGLLGIVLDPKFEQNHYVYLYFTYNEFFETKNKVVRYVESYNTLREDKVIVEPFAGASYHDGGRMKFGPDGKLYVTTGDAGIPSTSQNKDTLVGKILRINPDGTIPKDNPFGNAVYSMGHRNPQGIDWNANGTMFATEHGPSGWRGTAHDEINKIVPGGNYGWPEIIGDESAYDMIIPILHSGQETWAPSGMTFYYGNEIPQWHGNLFFAALRGEHLHMISFDQGEISSSKKLFEGKFGRIRDIAQGPDGYLYLLTSNRDGRGNPVPEDDRILRIRSISNTSNLDENISEIPIWIKQTAKWWSLTQISDQDFTLGLEYLIENKIILMPKDMTMKEQYESHLPSWLRENIGLWSKGLISDEEFFKSINWMIDNGFIKIQ